MGEMAKTHIQETLPCGCIQNRWLFGRAIIRHCTTHRMTLHPFELPRTWSARSAPTGQEDTDDE